MEKQAARSFVTVMVIIAISALILRVVVEQIIKLNIEQNESTAEATLKLLSTALENYAKENQGKFPLSLSLLTGTSPPYLDKDYVAVSPLKGYNYSCLRLEASGYSCSANPSICSLTGNKVYTITSGGLLVSEECSKKE